MSSHQIRVFDRIDRARSARSELISSGRRPQDVRILDAGPPIPETIAGMLVGAIFTTVLAVIPQIGPIFDRGGPMSYALIAIGALIGAVSSYLIARANPPLVIDRELGDGDYVVVCYDPPALGRAA